MNLLCNESESEKIWKPKYLNVPKTNKHSVSYKREKKNRNFTTFCRKRWVERGENLKELSN